MLGARRRRPAERLDVGGVGEPRQPVQRVREQPRPDGAHHLATQRPDLGQPRLALLLPPQQREEPVDAQREQLPPRRVARAALLRLHLIAEAEEP